jgi:hypothetical protein
LTGFLVSMIQVWRPGLTGREVLGTRRAREAIESIDHVLTLSASNTDAWYFRGVPVMHLEQGTGIESYERSLH